MKAYSSAQLNDTEVIEIWQKKFNQLKDATLM
jgi:hypothetical protein